MCASSASFFSFWFFVFIFRIPFIFFGFVFLANFLDQPASQQWTLPFDLVAQEDKSKYLLYKNRLDLLARNTIRDTSHGTGRVPGGISLLLAQIKQLQFIPLLSSLSHCPALSVWCIQNSCSHLVSEGPDRVLDTLLPAALSSSLSALPVSFEGLQQTSYTLFN